MGSTSSSISFSFNLYVNTVLLKPCSCLSVNASCNSKLNIDNSWSQFFLTVPLSLKYGFNGHVEHTLDEIGKMFSISKERVRQIVAKSERMLKHPAVMNEIINAGFADIFTKVNISRKEIKEAEIK